MKPSLFIFFISFFGILMLNAQELSDPSFEEIISLESVSNAVISPDGKHVLFTKQSVDWKKNRYDREIWLSKNGEEPFQLTNTLEGNSSNPQWSPDGKWISFLAKRGEKTQLHVLRAAGGEAIPLTHTKSDIRAYEWSPKGRTIAFLQSEDKSKEEKKRKDKYGGFSVDDGEYKLTQLWYVDFKSESLGRMLSPAQLEDSALKATMAAKPLIDSVDFTISSFMWSPDGKKIAIQHQPNPLINTFFKADISVYDLAADTITSLVTNPSYDGLVDWSPDGKSILYRTALDDSTSNYYLNGKLFRINLDGSKNKQLAKDFDENLSGTEWNENGIYTQGWQKTDRHLLRIDPTTGNTKIIGKTTKRIRGFSMSTNGKYLAFAGANDDNLPEIYQATYPFNEPKALTSSSKQIENWSVAQSEMISWKSEDGATIEGVLHKPMDYDPKKKYPLLVIIHGGPTGISTPDPTPSYVYPIVQWLNKGALILRPNYRGSAGYGEAFRSLNVRNLGVGDAWDVLSGVENLIDKGMVDADKMGCMGWSQGGYISAFLTTNSDKFQAVSVGAGISNWVTYYVNTDIHPFTRQYLKATPWSDMDIYLKTSPMTAISKAATPTLIQHGEFDRRVPIANAYELHQGLQDVGVTSKLVVYKGFGHGITKPKERLAATWHNWQWFAKYIWGEEVDMPEK
ncbi:MAG: S9 family peptidase [Bacteroidota bacterium]